MLTAKVLKLAQWARDSSKEHVTNGFRPDDSDIFRVAWAHDILKKRYSMRKIHQACEELVKSGELVRTNWSGRKHDESPIENRYYRLAPEQTPNNNVGDD